MILYNVTIGIDKEIEKEWLAWVKEKHIPSVMNVGVFVDYKFYKVLTHDDEGSSSYCIQYFTPTIDQFQQYLDGYAKSLIEEHHLKFKDRHVIFQTLLEEA
jgi:hypothetical protein